MNSPLLCCSSCGCAWNFCSTNTTPIAYSRQKERILEELEASYRATVVVIFEIFVYQQQLLSKRLLMTAHNSSSFFFMALRQGTF